MELSFNSSFEVSLSSNQVIVTNATTEYATTRLLHTVKEIQKYNVKIPPAPRILRILVAAHELASSGLAFTMKSLLCTPYGVGTEYSVLRTVAVQPPPTKNSRRSAAQQPLRFPSLGLVTP